MSGKIKCTENKQKHVCQEITWNFPFDQTKYTHSAAEILIFSGMMIFCEFSIKLSKKSHPVDVSHTFNLWPKTPPECDYIPGKKEYWNLNQWR